MDGVIQGLSHHSLSEFIQTQLFQADNGNIFICVKMQQRSHFRAEGNPLNCPSFPLFLALFSAGGLCYVLVNSPQPRMIMTLSVFCILLFAALLHASWNAIVKAGNDKLYSAIGVTGSAALIALVFIPFAPAPSAASVPFMIASTVLQVIYTVLVAKTYQISDMSQTYH